ncbi:MAG: helix-hairpin-helix domain-containing protein [Sulfurimonas sp.]
MKFLIVLVMSLSLLLASVDINTANADELTTLKGVGVSKARAIVAYRKGHCFKNIDDFTNVKGVGAKTLAKNRTSLTASKCKK